VFHIFFEDFGLLFLSPALQVGVMFADRDSAVFLFLAQAFSIEWTILAVFPGEFKPEAHLPCPSLFESTALAVYMPSGSGGSAVFHINVEVLYIEPTFEIPGFWGGTFQHPPFFIKTR
jgi:hypothetical protein